MLGGVQKRGDQTVISERAKCRVRRQYIEKRKYRRDAQDITDRSSRSRATDDKSRLVDRDKWARRELGAKENDESRSRVEQRRLEDWIEMI